MKYIEANRARDLIEEVFSEEWTAERSNEALHHIENVYERSRENFANELIIAFGELNEPIRELVVNTIKNKL